MPVVRLTIVAAFAALSVLSSGLGAQQADTGPRWSAWLGCWTAAPADEVLDKATESARIVCITPTADRQGVEIAAVAGGRVLTRDTLDATGRERRVDRDGCAGTQSGVWSADGRRVFLKSSVVCRGVPTEMSAILAVTPAGDWVDVRRFSTAQRSNVRIAQYRDVGLSASVPTDIAATLRARALSMEGARVAAGAPVDAAAITEATRMVDSGVVRAWILESGQQFASDTRGVTDAILRDSDDGEGGSGLRYGGRATEFWDQGTGMRYVFPRNAFGDPWGAGVWVTATRFGGMPVGYGFGNPTTFGYDIGAPLWTGFGWGYGYGWGYGFVLPEGNSPRERIAAFTPNVMVLKNDASGTEPKGRDSKGKDSKASDKGKTDDSVVEKIGAGIMRRASGKSAPAPATSAPRAGGGGSIR